MSRKSNNAPTTNIDDTKKSDFASCLTKFLANNHPKKSLGDHIGLVNQAQFNLIFDELEKRKHQSPPNGIEHQNSSGIPPNKVLEVQSSDLFSEEEFEEGHTNSRNATITGAGNNDEDDDNQSSRRPRRMRLNCEIDTIPGSGVNLDAVTSVNKLGGLELKNN